MPLARLLPAQTIIHDMAGIQDVLKVSESAAWHEARIEFDESSETQLYRLRIKTT